MATKKKNCHYLTKFSGMGRSFYADTITLGLNTDKRRIPLGLRTMAILSLCNTNKRGNNKRPKRKFQKFQFVFCPSIEIGVKAVSVPVSADLEVSWGIHPNIYSHQGLVGLKCQHAAWPLKELCIIWIDYIYALAIWAALLTNTPPPTPHCKLGGHKEKKLSLSTKWKSSLS